MTIRPATTSDISDIFAIRTSVQENHLSMEQLRFMGITEESIGNIISEEDCAWIAEASDMAVGFAMKQLMEKVERFLLARHDAIWLETDGSSRAAGFYAHLGWERAAELENGDVRFEKRAKQM